MNERPRWDKSWTQALDISNTMASGVVVLYQKQIDGVWNYAIVRWFYEVPHVLAEFTGGEIIYDHTE